MFRNTYGSDALGGVVQFLSRRAEPADISVETSYGNQNSPELSLWAGGQMQNLGRTRSTGIGLDAARLSTTVEISCGYEYVAATVLRFPANAT